MKVARRARFDVRCVRTSRAAESLGFGALAGLSGATSISFAKLCW